LTDSEIIQGCLKQDRQAQKALYDKYSPVMFGVCKRYCKNREDAEDVLINGLFKAINNIHQYSGTGNFEGWIRRIIVNEALMFLRKRKKITVEIEEYHFDSSKGGSIEDELAAQDILDLLAELPTGYRTIFNLYVLDGLKHREIAEALGISINTSKSQLILAKKRMQELLAKRAYPDLEGRKRK
jgi:RNA polymerase sigma-70 factor (ECF subfamily)